MSAARSAAVALALLLAVAPVLPAHAVAQAIECSDGQDNDRDGLTDYPSDSDCDSRIDMLERPSRADLTVTLSDGNAFVQRGDLLTYTLTIRNNLAAPYDAPGRVTLSNLTYLVGDAPAGAVEDDSRTLRWSSIQLNAGETKMYTFDARVVSHTPDNAGIVARAMVSTASATDQSIVRSGALPPAEISVRITDNRTEATRGEVLDYVITIENDSSYQANHLIVSAALPVYGEFVDAEEGGTWDGRNVRWLDLDVPARGSVMLHFSARVGDDSKDGRTLQASVNVQGVEATDATLVGGKAAPKPVPSPAPAGMADVLFRMESDRSEMLAGGAVFITLSARNTGTSPAAGLQVMQTYDPSMLAPSGAVSATSVQPGLLTWELPVLNAGESWQTTVAMTVAKGMHGANADVSATISGDGTDPANAVRSVSVGILGAMPATGAATDALALVLIAFAAAGIAFAQRKVAR